MPDRSINIPVNSSPDQIIAALKQYLGPSDPLPKVEVQGVRQYRQSGHSKAEVAFGVHNLGNPSTKLVLAFHVLSPGGSEDQAVRLAQIELLNQLKDMCLQIAAELQHDHS